jgi:predicted transcriptional regulator
MLDSIVTSKTRLQLLLQFFLNPDHSSYLRRLAAELGESTNAVRVELNRLEDAKLLTSKVSGRQKWYMANQSHPLFPELHSIMKKMLGFDKLEEILTNLGQVEKALVVGDYAKGIDSGIIDLIVVGDIDRIYLQSLVEKVESLVKRRIRTLVMDGEEHKRYLPELKKQDSLVIWEESKDV